MLTSTKVPCARSKSLFLTPQSFTVRKGLSEASSLYCVGFANTPCSSCRRIDSIPSPPTVNSEFDSTFQKTNLTELDMRDHLSAHLPALVPRLQPTTIAAVKEAQIPPNFHEGASDLDPTEWKPAEQVVEAATAPPETRIFTPGLSSCRAPPSGASSSSLSNSWKPKLHHRPSSAASIYLSQFYRSNDSLESLKHRSARATTSFNAHVTPVLSDSPTVSSTGSEESLSGTSYELVMRPRTVSGPTTAVTTSPTEEADVGLSDEKQHLPTVIDPSLRSASGSLRELLSGAKKTGVAM